MKRKATRVSLAEVAEAAGVSKMAASYALRNRPGVSAATRKRVAAAARRLGYAPDARMTSWMARVQGARSKDLLPIAWLNTTHERDLFHENKWCSPFLEGARDRCLELGYRLDEIWVRERGMTMRRLSQILYQRGIEGVIVTHPARHLHLRWEHLAGVAIEEFLLAPRLHRVTSDRLFNLALALKILLRHGYRRIAICLPRQMDNFPKVYEVASHHFVSTMPVRDQIPPLIYDNRTSFEKPFKAWVRRHRPHVIVGATQYMLGWIRELGLRVPQDVGLVHLWLDEDALDWAGIFSNKRGMGVTAADQVIAMVQSHRLGVPRVPLSTLLCGQWQFGKTLLVPNPHRK